MISHGRLGRPWTPYEDELLRAAVVIHGDNTEKWKTIALSVPGRTNKACRKRWLHSLSPSVKKSAWTAEEDGLLLTLFEQNPNKWSQIARQIPGRTDDACSKRYREALDPRLKKDEWTDEEDRRLLDALSRQGGQANPKWGLIGQELRRSGLGCRNRWRLLQRKINATARAHDPDALPQLSATDWPLSAEAEEMHMSLSFWSCDWSVLEPGLHFPRTSEIGPGLPPTSGEPVVAMRTGGIVQNGQRSAGVDEPPLLHTNQVHPHVSQLTAGTSNPSEGPVPDTIDFGFHDDYEDHSFNNTPEASRMADDSNSTHSATRLCTNETESLCSLGTLAHAASTLSPSPCAVPDLVVPPRKRRRTHLHPPAVSGMRVISDLVGNQKAAPKLSSSLPVADDSSIQAYACGHPACLPRGAANSTATVCFSTSGELLNHYKLRHMDDLRGCDEAPFRCALQGCNKGWKSINGLQYHLQISKVHYQDICSRAAAEKKQSDNEPAAGASTEARPSDDAASRATKRLHKCPHPGCAKEYKQLSGLRYHMLHGHPKDMPTQLAIAPPRIATQLGMEAPANTSAVPS